MKSKPIKKKISIKTRILISILSIIAAIIIGIFVSFNLLVNRYIEHSASEKLKEASKIIMSNEGEHFKGKPIYNLREENSKYDENFIRAFEEKVKKIKLQAEANVMIIDDNYDLIFPNENLNYNEDLDVYTDLLNKIKESKIDLNSNKNSRIGVEKKNYYISHEKINDTNSTRSYYLILFINIGDTLAFANQINLVLIVIMCIAGVLAIVTAFILSNKIARPIEQLSLFARKLGEGKFDKCDIDFADKEINELAEVMNKASKDLDKYDNEQKIFFQNASHELRTPLMSIKGYAEAIKYDVLDKNSASDVILEESDRLVDLIEELLYVSKMDNITKDYVLVEHDMREVLSNCTLKQKARAINLGIEFLYDFDENPVLLKCDEKSIYRAFLNIIENALRYAKSKIIIECKNIDDKIIISIKNDGEQIKEKDLPYIFERFYKGNKGKHGIGLSIVKTIISKHKGNIYAENIESGVEFKMIF